MVAKGLAREYKFEAFSSTIGLIAFLFFFQNKNADNYEARQQAYPIWLSMIFPGNPSTASASMSENDTAMTGTGESTRDQ